MVFCELHNGVACFSLSTVTLKLFGSRGNPERCWIAVMAAALRNSEIASAKARAAESLKESLKESLESLKEFTNIDLNLTTALNRTLEKIKQMESEQPINVPLTYPTSIHVEDTSADESALRPSSAPAASRGEWTEAWENAKAALRRGEIAVMAAEDYAREALRNSEIASAKARAAESLKESLKESLESLKELHNSLDAHGGCFAEVKAAESLNTVPGVAESEGVRATSPEESAPLIENGSRCYFDCGESEGRGNGGQVVGAEKVGVRGREEGITTEGKKLKVYR